MRQGRHQIPAYIQGVRRKYLEAIQADVDINRRYAATITGLNDATKDPREVEQHSLLLGRLDVLRLRRVHARLTILKHYVDELRGLSDQNGLFLPEDSDGANEAEPPSDDIDDRITSLVDSAQQLMTHLEQAVIGAKHEADRERSSLLVAKAQCQHSPVVRQEVRAHALAAVRDELTAWLEDSLAKCNVDGVSIPDPENDNQDADNQTALDQKIAEQYEHYLAARKRVIAAATALSSTTNDTPKEETTETVPVGNRHVQDAPNMTTNQLEQDYLPLRQYHATIQAYHSFATEQVEKETVDTIDMLEKLRDESQLLQAFPILARSGHFQHATSAFGKMPIAENPANDDELGSRIEAWSFAADAADTALKGTIEGQVKQGQAALEEVSERLAGLALFREAMNDRGEANRG